MSSDVRRRSRTSTRRPSWGATSSEPLLMSKRADAIRNVIHIKRPARAAGAVESMVVKAAKPIATKGFPYRKPTVPRGIEVPRQPSKIGADYETEWARKYPARLGRVLWTQGPMRLMLKGVGTPTGKGAARLEDLRQRKDPPPLIFLPNHNSHLAP